MFFLQIQSINITYRNKENMIVVPLTKRIEVIIGLQVCLFSQMSFDIRIMVERKAFLAIPKHQDRISQWEEHDCSANNERWSLLQVSEFVLFHGWSLIIKKIVERKGFLANPKHQYNLSQWGEHDCRAQNKKNGGYYGYPSFLIPQMNINYK